MMYNSPHILLTEYKNYYILFDVNRNTIKEISRTTYIFLQEIISKNVPISKNLLREAEPEIVDEIKKMVEEGLLKSKRPTKIQHPLAPFYQHYLNNRLQDLILQVTKSCNFRCSYCDFSCDDMTHRSHENINMSWEVAKKAICFFKERTRDQRRVIISFYGGEPLINFALIKKCIEHANAVFMGKEVVYSLTTNASLLTPEITKYLIDNNTNIVVSLDGPQSVNDKNRKLKIDGSGTFEIVDKNLKTIKEHLPEYYKKLGFNCVIDPANSNRSVNEFFKRDEYKNNLVRYSPMHPVYGRAVYYPPEFVFEQKKSEIIAGYNAIVNHATCPSIESQYIFQEISKFERNMQLQCELPDVFGHSGPCMPGVHRLFVSVEGKLFPCEKANESSDVMNIGDIYNGFDTEKAIKMLNITQLNSEKCRNCWGIMHCNICACTVDGGDRFSKEILNQYCAQTLNTLRKSIVRAFLIRKLSSYYSNEKTILLGENN